MQNEYSLVARFHGDVLAYWERNGIGFIPFWPLHGGALAQSHEMASIADTRRATPAQVSLAWLLRKSPNIILIPGTSSVAHLEENFAARSVALSEDDMATLEALSIPDRSPK